MKPKDDFKGRSTSVNGINGNNFTIREGGSKIKTTIVYEEQECHSDPGVYYATTKRKIRKLKKNKSKTKGV